MNKYTRWEGITRAIGSIIGSGILFLPSYTYAQAGGDVLISWLLAIIVCIPGVFFLSEMVESVKDNSGIGGFISIGLGERIGSLIPILMLSTVCIGMPSAALIAGEYVGRYFEGSSYINYFMAMAIIWFGVFSNLKKMKTSSKILTAITVSLIVLSVVLIGLTTNEASAFYSKITPSYEIEKIVAAMVLAFWAFAGFENLTFMANKFKNPKKDILISSITAIVVCGLIYFLLTLNYAALAKGSSGDKLSGLFTLSEVVSPKSLSTLVITLFAVFAVQINFNTWIEGISSMTAEAARSGYLPTILESVDQNNNPKNAIIGIGIVFSVVVTFAFFVPSVFGGLLKTVSTNFLIMYLLAMVSYQVTAKSGFKKVISTLFVIALILVILGDYRYLIYPVLIMLLAGTFNKKRVLC